MKTATLLSPHALAEADVGRALEQQFAAAWFPQYHRWSIDADDAFVAVDFDPGYVARLAPEDQRTLAAQLGFTPRTALHIQSSPYHAGSEGLAERVFEFLSHRFEGRVSAAA